MSLLATQSPGSVASGPGHVALLATNASEMKQYPGMSLLVRSGCGRTPVSISAMITLLTPVDVLHASVASTAAGAAAVTACKYHCSLYSGSFGVTAWI